MHDGVHSQKPTGHVLAAVVGKLIEGEEPSQVAREDRIEQAQEFIQRRKVEPPKELPSAKGPALLALHKLLGSSNGDK